MHGVKNYSSTSGNQGSSDPLQIPKALPVPQYRFSNPSLNASDPDKPLLFKNLPTETITNIANFLSIRDLNRFSLVCKLFYNHSQNASHWRNPCFNGDRIKTEEVLNNLKEYKGSYVFDTLFQRIASKTAPRLYLPALVATLKELGFAQQRHFVSEPVISALEEGTLNNNQAVELARLLDQEINDRNPANLVKTGLLNQEAIQSLSPTQQRQLLHSPVILALLKKTLNSTQALELARLLDQQSPNQRDPSKLIDIGLLKQENLDQLATKGLGLSNLSETKRNYLTSEIVIFHLLNETPDLGAFAYIDDEYIAADGDGISQAFDDERDDVIAYMLRSKLFLNIADDDIWTPLHRAVNAENHQTGIKLIEFLIASGADVNKSDDLDMMPLHYAAEQGYIEGARLLLNAKADVNQPDFMGCTPLHSLIIKSQSNNDLEQNIKPFAELLLQAGANVSQRDDTDMTALDYVNKNLYPQVAQTLRDWENHNAASR